MVIIEVYVDNIIFGSGDDRISENFTIEMIKEFSKI